MDHYPGLTSPRQQPTKKAVDVILLLGTAIWAATRLEGGLSVLAWIVVAVTAISVFLRAGSRGLVSDSRLQDPGAPGAMGRDRDELLSTDYETYRMWTWVAALSGVAGLVLLGASFID